MVKIWEVVGGADTGGILVRQGKDMDSDPLGQRLSTGALIREIEIDKTRLKYKRISGSGPLVGWVTIQTKNAVLVSESDLTLQEATKVAVAELADAKNPDPEGSPAEDAASSQGAPEDRREDASLPQGVSEDRREDEGFPEESAPSSPEPSRARRRANWQGESSAAPPITACVETGPTAEDVLWAQLEQLSEGRARLPEPGTPEPVDTRLPRTLGRVDASVQVGPADESHERNGEEGHPVDIEEVERIARDKLEQRMRVALEAEQRRRARREAEERYITAREAAVCRVYRSCWGDGAEEYNPEVYDFGGLISSAVQAAWVYDGVLHVVSGGKVGTMASEERWDGKWRDWGRIFHGSVQAAWWCDDHLYVVKQEKVAQGRLGPSGGVRWDGSLHDWGHLLRGNVMAAWVEDGNLYVAKRYGREVEMCVCTWGDQWDGRAECWPWVLDRSCKTAWVDGGFIYVVREITEATCDTAGPSHFAPRQVCDREGDSRSRTVQTSNEDEETEEEEEEESLMERAFRRHCANAAKRRVGIGTGMPSPVTLSMLPKMGLGR